MKQSQNALQLALENIQEDAGVKFYFIQNNI